MNHWYLIITLIGPAPAHTPAVSAIEFDSRAACERAWDGYNFGTVKDKLTAYTTCVAKGEWK